MIRSRLVSLFLGLPCLLAAFALSISVASGQSVELVRGPYVQDVTTTSALICWAANASHAGAVAYGPAPTLTSSAPAPDAAAGHCVRLSALVPFTRYSYQIKTDGVALSAAFTFRTMAGPGDGPVKFVAWGDTRTGDAVHGRLVARIAPLAPDFVLNVGDLVENGRRMDLWNAFFRLEQPLVAASPLYPVLGNHEENSPLYFELFSLPGNERWYSFDTGPLHVIALDVYFSPYGPGSEQHAWLEQDLRETTRPWKVILLHSPPYSYAPSRGEGEEPVRAAIVPLVEKYGVQLVISGHNHLYQRNVINGVTYLTAGAGGAPLHAVGSGPGMVYAESVPHFARITASATELASVGVRQEGSEFDPFTLRQPAPGGAVPELAAPGVGATLPPPAQPSLLDQYTCRRCHLEFPLTSWAAAQDGWKQHGDALAIIVGVAAATVLLIILARRALQSRGKGIRTDGTQSQSRS